MAEIDPVVLQLRADVSQHERELRGSTRTVDKEFGYQEARVRRLEQEFKQSSGAIGGSIKALAATLATAFTGRELIGLADSFTRFENSLKVAGRETAQQFLNSDEVADYKQARETLRAMINEPIVPEVITPSTTSASGGGVKKDTPKKGTGPTGPSLAEIEDRFQNERAQLMAQFNSTLRSTARSAEEVAEYELRNVELARIRTTAAVEADQDYSEAQKKVILGLVEEVAAVEREAVEFQKRARLEQESADLAEARYRASFESLQLQYELADTDAERQAIAVRILEAEDAFLRSKLEAVAANQTLADAERQQARIALAALNATAAQRREATIRNNETPVQRYLRGVNKTPEQINEALDNIQLDGLDALNDGLVEAIRGTRSLGDTFSSIADQIVADLLRIAVRPDDRCLCQRAAQLVSVGQAASRRALCACISATVSSLSNWLPGSSCPARSACA